MVTFTDFRDGSGGRLLRTLGVDISRLQTWREYTDTMLGMAGLEAFLSRVRDCAQACSPSELAVLGAVLTAMDFAWLADELLGGEFWQRTGNFDRYTAAAIAAVILRQNSAELRAAA